MSTYAAYYNNSQVRMESSSGGLFTLIAEGFDVTYGVAMTDDCYGCEFIRVEKKLERLRGSKYLQARVGDTFKHVKRDLLDHKRVLFSGTGCQINGLIMFLGKEYPNLLLVDIICHGVPSPKLWREYIKYQEKTLGKIRKISFRDKTEGWLDFGMMENAQFSSMHTDPFMQMFLRNYCLRPSCYECHAKELKKSDITIADFWGIQDVVPEINDNKGISLVITRTSKGQDIFEKNKDMLIYKEVTYEEGIRCNTAEYLSAYKPKLRNSFFIDLNRLSFDEMIKKYASTITTSKWEIVLKKYKNYIKKILRRN